MVNTYLPEKTVSGKESNSITQATVNELNAALSKTGKAILISLYRTPEMQQKALAASVHTSASSLSNILNRLVSIQPQLLNVETSGRYKYYSLTKIAEQYVAKCLLPRETYNINTFFSVPTNDALVNDTLSILYQFQSAAGSEWALVLDDMLSEGLNANKDDSDLSNLYTGFINNMNQIYMQEANLSLQKIYDALGNVILVKRLESYLRENLKDRHALIPLFNLEKQDPLKAIQLIHYAFAEMKPQIFEPEELSLFPDGLPVLREQYHAVFHKLSLMANEFSDNYTRKTEALEHWKNTFYVSNLSLDCIAEKCHTIYLAESGNRKKNI